MKEVNLKIIFIVALSFAFALNVQSQQTFELWGMTSEGGADNQGAIFKTDTGGLNPILVHSFDNENEGGIPKYVKLCQAGNGKLYGMTSTGRLTPWGVIFEFDPSTGIYTVKHTFNANIDGREPVGSLIQASNGKLYGMTEGGGQYNRGVIFEYDFLSNAYSKKLDFGVASMGRDPEGGLLEALNGKLYGLTEYGGNTNQGVLFEYDISTNTMTNKVHFDGTNKGAYPKGTLIQTSNGKLYGQTTNGGVNNHGVLFECDTLGNFAVKKEFLASVTGNYGRSELLQASNGKLYGTNSNGGSTSYGTLFEYDIAMDTLIVRHQFTGLSTGEYPVGAVVQVGNKLYGNAARGGQHDFGVVYAFDINTNVLAKEFDFAEMEYGAFPNGTPMLASNGKLYGVTAGGGTSGYGALYEFDTSGTMTKMLDFDGSPNGSAPQGSLIRGSDGKLYGMTKTGGDGYGIIFKIDPATNTFTRLQSFDGSNGCAPYGDLVQANNGKMYGLTTRGGLYDKGVLFEYNVVTNNIINHKNLQSSSGVGSEPYGSMILAANGLLYGLTSRGGSGTGVIFEFNPNTNVYTKKINLTSATSGEQPYGDLVEAGNGKLYGLTYWGGANNRGALFEYTPSTNTVVKKVDLNTPTGIYPWGSLVEAQNGKLYGMTEHGGAGGGVIFQYDPATNAYTKQFDFTGSNGYHPFGALIETSNGRMFGMAREGGIGHGVLFEYDTNGVHTKKFDFNGANGSVPYSGRLLELSICFSTHDTISATACDQYISPGGQVLTSSGTYLDTVINVCNGDSINTIFLTILNSSGVTDKHTACSQYQWIDGNIYTSSNNTATFVLTNAAGCDSVITLDLTIHQVDSTVEIVSACDSFMWSANNQYYTVSGDYTELLTNAQGCDSTVTLHLTVIHLDNSVAQSGATLSSNDASSSHQWVDCDDNFAPISGETSQTFTATKNGNYAVIITQSDCVDTSDCFVIEGLGIITTGSGDFYLKPNPNSGRFSIGCSKEVDGRLFIYGMEGSLVHAETVIRQSQVDVALPESLSSGTYFLKFVTKDEVITRKIILSQ